MGARYLIELADVCRATGLPVVEVDGWQTRARGSGGYDAGRPNHVLVHHTASPPSADGWPDVDYCTFQDDDAPLCNLYLSRDGTIYVCAAGATNTNGSGHDPCGWTADDAMNSSAIGIEAGSDGVGEAWPAVQLDAYVALCRQLCAAYDIPTGRVHAHFEWAPSRKTDPVGPDRYAAGSSSWDMAAFRADIDAAPLSPPTPEEDHVPNLVARTDDGVPWVVAADLSWRYAVNEGVLSQLLAVGDGRAYATVHFDAALINAIPTIDLHYPYEWTAPR